MGHPSINSLDQHIAARLKHLRKAHGISLEKLAEVIGVSQQQMSRYERGHNHLAAAHLYLLAEAFDVPISYFYVSFDDKRNAMISVTERLQANWPKANKTTTWKAEDDKEREALLSYYWRRLPSGRHQEIVIRLLEVVALGK